ncbi:MAG: MBL fold metallo-hydrolase [Deltaproteobacteria bacterium]|nr:MBL fold metallo-hydrolase [Deltaproteobacteria bacterium]MBW1817635.1 MBL fold metallo-hydrolase [Deltaproteobacteria bacterium]
MITAAEYDDVLQINLCRYPEMMPALTVSAYLVDGLLIDTGPAHTAKELVQFLEDRELDKVVNTHHHEDHIGANKLLQEQRGIEIFAHSLAVEKIGLPAVLYPYQEEVWGYPVPSIVKPLGTRIGTKKYMFEIVHTPGHDRDCICLLERKSGLLFSGDLFLGSKPSACRPMEDCRRIIKDLKLVQSLRPRLIFSALGSVIADPKERLEKVVGNLKNLGRRIHDLHAQGLNPTEIRQRIFGEESPMAPRTQFQFSSENLVKSFLNGDH